MSGGAKQSGSGNEAMSVIERVWKQIDSESSPNDYRIRRFTAAIVLYASEFFLFCSCVLGSF